MMNGWARKSIVAGIELAPYRRTCRLPVTFEIFAVHYQFYIQDDDEAYVISPRLQRRRHTVDWDPSDLHLLRFILK